MSVLAESSIENSINDSPINCISVKLIVQESVSPLKTISRFKAPLSLDFDDLFASCVDLANSKSIRLCYNDPEGDMCTIQSQIELDEAFSLVTTGEMKLVKIFIYPSISRPLNTNISESSLEPPLEGKSDPISKEIPFKMFQENSSNPLVSSFFSILSSLPSTQTPSVNQSSQNDLNVISSFLPLLFNFAKPLSKSSSSVGSLQQSKSKSDSALPTAQNINSQHSLQNDSSPNNNSSNSNEQIFNSFSFGGVDNLVSTLSNVFPQDQMNSITPFLNSLFANSSTFQSSVSNPTSHSTLSSPSSSPSNSSSSGESDLHPDEECVSNITKTASLGHSPASSPRNATSPLARA